MTNEAHKWLPLRPKCRPS